MPEEKKKIKYPTVGILGLIQFVKDSILDKSTMIQLIKSSVIKVYSITDLFWDIPARLRSEIFKDLPRYVDGAGNTGVSIGPVGIQLMKYNGEPYGVMKLQPSETNHPETTCLMYVPNTKHHKKLFQLWVKQVSCKIKQYNLLNGKLVVQAYMQQRCGPSYISVPARRFETLYLDTKIRDSLIQHIENFLKSKEWYASNGIPYHYGILLYGPPGTGKTSIVKALATTYSFDISIIPGDEISNITNCLTTHDDNKCRIICIEDIDTAGDIIKQSDDQRFATADKENSTGFGSILNIIDGAVSPENVIFVFTTNHIDKLDPALLRPGRIDLKMNIGYMNDDSFNQFLMKLFGEKMPNDCHIKPDIAPCRVQEDLINNLEYDQFLEKYTTHIE